MLGGFSLLGNTASGDGRTIESKLKERKVSILGKHMTYLEGGKGDPIIFIHGNPTRAYIWRNIIPHLLKHGRCIAPDLIGMGNSDKLDSSVKDRYTFNCHQRFINSFLKEVLKENDKVILVGHDWGGVLSHDWARKNENRVKGIVFMETFLEPNITGQTPEFVIQWFKNFRSEEFQDKVLNGNHFIENILLKALPNLTESDREIYREPYKNSEERLPTLVWPQEVPIDETPKQTHDVFTQNIQFMATTRVPKLFISADPGALLGHEARKSVIRKWPNLSEVNVKGNHYIQEQCPNEIGMAISSWILSLEDK